MNTILYTGYDDPYEALADITVPRMQAYAKKHGYRFQCYVGPLINIPNGIYWTGVCGALEAFKDGYERAIYLDVDQLVTNMEYNIPDFKSGFHVSKDWGDDAVKYEHFSACGFVANNDTYCKQFLNSVRLMAGARKGGDFPEQFEMRSTYRLQKEFGQNWITVHPRKVFNNVPDQVCPGKVPEPWKLGDWCVHLTMLPLDERIKLAKEILKLCQ
jgi:hypothetical protein